MTITSVCIGVEEIIRTGVEGMEYIIIYILYLCSRKRDLWLVVRKSNLKV